MPDPHPLQFEHDGRRWSWPAPWHSDDPDWLVRSGRTTVLVLDDQVQSPSALTDDAVLEERIAGPLNVRFEFMPACAPGHTLARDGRWIPAALERVAALRPMLACVILDLMFDGERDALSGSGLRMLERMTAEHPGVPVIVTTQARDVLALRQQLARAGVVSGFLHKHSSDVANDLLRALLESAWLSDPSHVALSEPMRAAVLPMRAHLMNWQTLASGMPRPLLFLGESGEGKSHAAGVFARLVRDVRPVVRTSDHVGYLDCNTLERGQGAQMALFGRGARERGEQRQRGGLVTLGLTQQCDRGTLIIDEIGNSERSFQDLLLSFVDTGRTQPEFVDQSLTRDALGPLDVLCLFTAQPAHIALDRISPDLKRRYSRGNHVALPPLYRRAADVVPMFLLARAPAASNRQESPEQTLLPEAEQWLLDAVNRHRLTASELSDLASVPGPVVGVPALQSRLRYMLDARRSQPQPTTAPAAADPSHATPAESRPHVTGAMTMPRALEALLDPKTGPFPHELSLKGQYEKVSRAAARLMLAYLEAAVECVAAGRPQFSALAAYRFVTAGGEADADANTARSRLKDVLTLDSTASLETLARSDAMLALAVQVAKGQRSRPVARLLHQLSRSPDQAARLASAGWNSPTAIDDSRLPQG